MPTDLHDQLEAVAALLAQPENLTRDQLATCIEKTNNILPELIP